MLNKHIYQLQGMYFLTFFMTNVFFSFLTDAPFVNTSKTTGVMQFHCSLNSNLTINIMPVLQNTQQPKQCELHAISFLAYTLCWHRDIHVFKLTN